MWLGWFRSRCVRSSRRVFSLLRVPLLSHNLQHVHVYSSASIPPPPVYTYRLYLQLFACSQDSTNAYCTNTFNCSHDTYNCSHAVATWSLRTVVGVCVICVGIILRTGELFANSQYATNILRLFGEQLQMFAQSSTVSVLKGPFEMVDWS